MTATQFGDHPSERKTVALEDLTPMAKVQEVGVGLPATSRCDRCVAQAYVEVRLKSGAEMLFCGHHYVENEADLILKADRVIDHRPFLRKLEGDRP